jgi:hypothetical protein
VNQNFNITVSRGQVAWNTTGQGTITLVMTFSNGEKLELILDYKITRSAPMTTDFVARVQAALAVGWRNLGHLTGDVFHESDILYDPESKMYYAINTSADGNSGDPHIGWRRASTPEGIVSGDLAQRSGSPRYRSLTPPFAATRLTATATWLAWTTASHCLTRCTCTAPSHPTLRTAGGVWASTSSLAAFRVGLPRRSSTRTSYS